MVETGMKRLGLQWQVESKVIKIEVFERYTQANNIKSFRNGSS
jgi:hypothetical protein